VKNVFSKKPEAHETPTKRSTNLQNPQVSRKKGFSRITTLYVITHTKGNRRIKRTYFPIISKKPDVCVLF
jgi:hypothetical protein